MRGGSKERDLFWNMLLFVPMENSEGGKESTMQRGRERVLSEFCRDAE